MIFLFVSYWMIFGSDDRDMSICAPGLWKVVQRFGGCCRRCQSVQDAWCRFFNYILESIDSSWCSSSVYHASIPCQKFQPTALVVGDGTFYRDIGDSFQMIDEVCFSSTKNQEHNRVFQHVWTFFQVFGSWSPAHCCLSLQSTAQVAFHSVPQEGLLISSMAASADGGQKTGETEVGKAS